MDPCTIIIMHKAKSTLHSISVLGPNLVQIWCHWNVSQLWTPDGSKILNSYCHQITPPAFVGSLTSMQQITLQNIFSHQDHISQFSTPITHIAYVVLISTAGALRIGSPGDFRPTVQPSTEERHELKKMFSFGQLPESPNPYPPNSGNLVLFFGRQE